MPLSENSSLLLVSQAGYEPARTASFRWHIFIWGTASVLDFRYISDFRLAVLFSYKQVSIKLYVWSYANSAKWLKYNRLNLFLQLYFYFLSILCPYSSRLQRYTNNTPVIHVQQLVGMCGPVYVTVRRKEVTFVTLSKSLLYKLFLCPRKYCVGLKCLMIWSTIFI